jgi:serine protease Do
VHEEPDAVGAGGGGRHRKRRRLLPALALVAAASLVGAGWLARGSTTDTFGSTSDAISSLLQTSPAPELTASAAASASDPSGLPAVIASAMDSVVSVRSVSSQLAPFGGSVEAESQGSGVIVDTGLVVTNAHVVEGATRVSVSFGDAAERVTATVLGTDATHDIAVLSVATGDHPAIALGSSSDLALGQQVVALGYPLDLGATATAGIVSGLDRTIDVSGSTPGTVEHLEGLLQTDAAINPGNSGGPLIDASGRLVGINTAGASASSAENIGFAIAIDEALPVIRDLAAGSA